MKRILLLISAFVASITALWAHDLYIDGIYYNLDEENKTAEVTFGKNKCSENIIIPETITYNSETYTVTSIGNDAFRGCSGLTSVTIPNSVTSIGRNTFDDCRGLTSITIPNSVTEIGWGAFMDCVGLTSIIIPNSVTKIDDHAFDTCTGLTSITLPNSITSISSNMFNFCIGLTSITIPNSVTSIGDCSFQNCSSLSEVTIPNSVTEIGNYALVGCSGLTSITIPNSVTEIGNSAFEGCSNLKNIIVSSDNPSYASEDGVLFNKNKTVLEKFPEGKELTSYTIPSSVTSIGEYAFYGCSGLTSVTIPNSVTSIGYYAFYGCSSLTEVTIPNSVTKIDVHAFWDCSNLKNIIVSSDNPYYASEDGVLFNKNKTVLEKFPEGKELTSYTIPSSVTSIGEYAFYGCSSLTSVTIPNSVTSIGSSAFSSCTGLTSITISNSVTEIGSFALSGCSSLTEVTIPNSVTKIDDDAFYRCSGLTSVIWNAKNYNDFEDYDETPFYYIRSQITSFSFGNEVEHIPANLCYGMSNLKTITIPNSVTSIGTEAFSGWSSLTSVTWNAKKCENFSSSSDAPFYDNRSQITSFNFGNEVEHIPAYLCYEISNLKTINIPNSVTEIGSFAFEGCSGLTKVNYLGTVDKWAEFDFRNFYDNPTYYAKNLYINGELLTSLEITSTDSIKQYAFYNCQSIKSVEIGNNVTSIGSSAFNGCNGLTSVTWNAKNWADFSSSSYAPFYNIRSQITSFTIGNEVEHIPAYLCYGMSNLKTITIPNSVTSIGDYSFSYCGGLTKVNYLGTVDKWVKFDWNYYDSNPTYYAKNLYINGELLTDLKLLSADSIKQYAFYNCQSIKSVEIGNNVTSIGSSAFNGCNGLTSVTWNAKNWADFSSSSYAPFYNIRPQITSFTIGNEVEHIPAYLCYEMSNLKTINIPNSVTEIGSFAFEGCSGLTKVNYLGTVDKWAEFDFRNSYDNPTYYAKNLYIDGDLLTDLKISADSIKDNAFYNCQNIKSVEIGNSVTSIGSSAFSGCTGLTSVVWRAKNYKDFKSSSDAPFYNISSQIASFNFGKEVGNIPAYLCYEMSNLKKINIPNSATSIGTKAFSGCSKFSSVTIPNSVTSIGTETFSGCSSLISVIWNAKNCADFSSSSDDPFYDISSQITSFTFGNEVEHIPAYLCYGMNNLKTITIPNSVTSIGDYSFSYCGGLTKVNYLGTVDKWAKFDWNYYDSNPTYYAKNLYINGELLTDLKLLSADSIKQYAFYNCQSIKSVEIGNNVTSIGSSAFNGCNGLTSVTWNAKNWEDFSSSSYAPFYNIRSQITSFTIGNEVVHIPAYLCYVMSKLKIITIPNSVTSIGVNAFYGCSGLTKVNYLGTVDKWVELDFRSSYDNPTYYGKNLYIDGDLLTDVKITEADSIKDNAFYNCQNIKSVEIGNSVTSIGSSAFSGCTGLTSVVWRAKNYKDFKSSSDAPFYNISSQIASFNFGKEVGNIPAYLCYEMSKLKIITIPNSVTSIGVNAFYGCSGLTKVNYLGTVDKWVELDFRSSYDNPTYYGKNLYIDGNLLTDVKITEADSIKDNAFYNCQNIKSVEIGNSVTSIGSSAFSGCTGLTSVVWRAKNYKDFKSSSDAPFYNISSQITSFTFGSEVEHLPAYLCSNMTLLTEISIPSKVNSIGENVFKDCSRLRYITSYSTFVPLAKENSFNSYSAYLYVPCDYYDYYYLDDIFGNFKYIKCIAAEEVDAPEKVEIEVDEDNNANIIWPSTDGAKTYKLEISKDGEVFCTLLFNENGQLTSIDFGNRSASVGFQFTVIGLDGASKYAYSMLAMDKKGNELQSYKGTFTTNGYVPGPDEEDIPTSITETLADVNITVSNGTISAGSTFSIYNTIGQDVTALNGNLQPGIYVVALSADRVKVMIK